MDFRIYSDFPIILITLIFMFCSKNGYVPPHSHFLN